MHEVVMNFEKILSCEVAVGHCVRWKYVWVPIDVKYWKFTAFCLFSMTWFSKCNDILYSSKTSRRIKNGTSMGPIVVLNSI